VAPHLRSKLDFELETRYGVSQPVAFTAAVNDRVGCLVSNMQCPTTFTALNRDYRIAEVASCKEITLRPRLHNTTGCQTG